MIVKILGCVFVFVFIVFIYNAMKVASDSENSEQEQIIKK